MTNPEDIKNLVNEITNFVNSYTVDEQQFIECMSREHRTLQQSFTRLVLKWLEHCASDDYRFDDRNRGAHETAKKLIGAFSRAETHSRTGIANPSDFLPFI